MNDEIETHLHVVYALDDNFAILTGVSIRSLLENNHTEFDQISIHVIDGGISEGNKEKINDIVTSQQSIRAKIDIHFYSEFDKSQFIGLPESDRWTLASWLRLAVSDILSASVKTCLFLDGDTVVNGSLKDLMAVRLNDILIGGVVDMFNSDRRLQKRNLPENCIYLNAGVLLMNLAKMREDHFSRKIVEYAQANKEYFVALDQDTISGYVGGKYLLPPKYNNIGYGYLNIDTQAALYPKGYGSYTNEEISLAQKDPIIYHYGGTAYFGGRFLYKRKAWKWFRFYKKSTPYKTSKDIHIPKRPGALVRILSAWMFFRAPTTLVLLSLKLTKTEIQ